MRHQDAQLRLDTSSSAPAYLQIADQLRTFAVEGVLEPGDSLPPVRRLALELGVHFNTVAEAYRVLAEEDFLEITHGHRARVVNRASLASSDPSVADSFHQRLRELVARVRARGLSTRQIARELRTMAEGLENT